MSTEELFDVVDKHDNVVDVKTRSEVHHLGLRHRAVHVFLFRSDGQMLIHLRTATKEEFPSVWTSSACGHVSAGEGYADSVGRELQEELGISADLQRALKVDACPDTSNEFSELYTATSDAEVEADPAEIAEIAWVSLEEIQSRLTAAPADFSPAFRLLFRKYRELG